MNREICFMGNAAVVLFAASAICVSLAVAAPDSPFHNAPASAAAMKNAYPGDANAAAGKKLYAQNCAQCHGNNLQGMGPAPTLESTTMKSAKPGEIFWFITSGDVEHGMPAWTSLTPKQRWQIITFLEQRNK